MSWRIRIKQHVSQECAGGNIFCGVMMACPLMGRYVRDGITVQVIFLEEEEEYSGIGVVSGGGGVIGLW